MKLIRISTDLKMTTHEFPKGTIEHQNEVLQGLIGTDCNSLERVLPKRLYTELHHAGRPEELPGSRVNMLVDEEGLLKKEQKPNPVGSYLYETDKHGWPIIGNILFVGEYRTEDGPEFCGIEEKAFERLEQQLSQMIRKMKERMA